MKLSSYFEEKLSKYQCGFRKGFSTQQCLLVMIEYCRNTLDKGGSFGALLTDLSKALIVYLLLKTFCLWI